jgi:hypothetical protein
MEVYIHILTTTLRGVQWPASHPSPPSAEVKERVELYPTPLFAAHIRSLTERFDSKFGGVENPLVRQLGRYLRRPMVDPRLPAVSRGTVIDRLLGTACLKVAISTYESRPYYTFDYPEWGFSVLFSLVVRRMLGYNTLSRDTARTPFRQGGFT